MSFEQIEDCFNCSYRRRPARHGMLYWQVPEDKGAGEIRACPMMEGFWLIFSDYCLQPGKEAVMEAHSEDIVLIQHVLEGGGYLIGEDDKTAIFRKGETLYFSGDFRYDRSGTLEEGLSAVSIFIEREKFDRTLKESFLLQDEEMQPFRRRFASAEEIIIASYNPLLYEKAAELKLLIQEEQCLKVRLEGLELLRLDGDFYLHKRKGSKRFYPEEYVNKVKDVADYMKDNPEERLCLNDLSTDFSINKTYLKEIFQELYGMPPMRYFWDIRLQRGRELLEAGFPVLEVALRVGYDNPSKFTAAFKKKYGYLPSHAAKHKKLQQKD